MASRPTPGATPGAADRPVRRSGAEEHPEPGPAPVGPAVHEPPQQPADTPHDPGPAPVGPAVHPERTPTPPPGRA